LNSQPFGAPSHSAPSSPAPRPEDNYQIVEGPEREEPESEQFKREKAAGMWIKRKREINVVGFHQKLKLFGVQSVKEPELGTRYTTAANLVRAIEMEGAPDIYERKPSRLINNLYFLRQHLRLLTPQELSERKKKLKSH
jgi:hypothetical protein